MDIKKYLLVAFIISLMSVIGFGIISILVSDEKIRHFDSTIISAVQGLETPVLTKVMKFFTYIGSTKVVIILSLFLLFFLYKVLHHRLELILFVSVIAGAGILNGLLKHFFHRARPNLHRLIEISGYSFPSGHAMSTFALYGIIAFLLWRHISSRMGRTILIIISCFMILAIGISRIYLGVHYPSDIIGGYFASGFWLAAAIWFFQFYKEKSFNRMHIHNE
ncbi:phosphatase PAP2 family protein [Bacillus sp. MUM 116]|uniref:phosphatase PAP2 family protein n=1 Tax=Bacillus sp. MUM 116 TaxID=1678002 RepID=UPI0008F59E42|nr:phosphatase PAP2 family protein [Bacillus sp. MUM 116]OIK15655.1 phosphatase PAP2 family protein [Bacillus sp. MUM 116]